MARRREFWFMTDFEFAANIRLSGYGATKRLAKKWLRREMKRIDPSFIVLRDGWGRRARSW